MVDAVRDFSGSTLASIDRGVDWGKTGRRGGANN